MNKENCLSNILKVINVIQKSAEKLDCNYSCTRPILGNTTNNQCFNTRLVTFYRCDNSLVSLPYTLNNLDEETTIFRIENVTCDSVTVALIHDNGDGTYTNTLTYATINLSCICAICCIGDTTLTNIYKGEKNE